MSEAPDNSNRLAWLLGLIFHPAIIMLPTLWLILNDIAYEQAIFWMALISGIILIPGFSVIAFQRRRERYTYQRNSRSPFYMVAWLSVLLCLLLGWGWNAPRVLMSCLAALALWLPIQLLINHYFTKISTHTAVVAGCFTALLLLGKLNDPLLFGVSLGISLLTIWARVVTKNHTLLQVGLGFLVGAGTVLLVFPIMN